MKLINNLLLILTVGLFILSGCSIDDDKTVTANGQSSADAELVTPAAVTDVVIDTQIIVEFDMEMDMSTIDSTSFTVSESGGNVIDGEFTFNAESTIAIFSPLNDLLPETTYTVAISDSVEDYQGNYFKSDSFTFSTIDDDSTGTVSEQSLADAELVTPVAVTDVVVDTRIMVEFDMEMNMSTIDSTSFIVSENSGNIVNGEFTFNAENTIATFSPASDLLPETTYTVAISDSVEDYLGNYFKNDSFQQCPVRKLQTVLKEC